MKEHNTGIIIMLVLLSVGYYVRVGESTRVAPRRLHGKKNEINKTGVKSGGGGGAINFLWSLRTYIQ